MIGLRVTRVHGGRRRGSINKHVMMRHLTVLIFGVLLSCNSQTQVPSAVSPLDSMPYLTKENELVKFKIWNVTQRSGGIFIKTLCDSDSSYKNFKHFVVIKKEGLYGVKSVQKGEDGYAYFDSSSILDTSKYATAKTIIDIFNFFKKYGLDEIRHDCKGNWTSFITDNGSITYKYDSMPPIDTNRPQLKFKKIMPNWYK